MTIIFLVCGVPSTPSLLLLLLLLTVLQPLLPRQLPFLRRLLMIMVMHACARLLLASRGCAAGPAGTTAAAADTAV
jgi:hypothetical protein